ncbi:hypothetical protein DLAC_04334 [Tieghemostelium lacteum]|uniref:Uncharacterized protein n=1 Tax=Tieghemostelium lacteum TaxID=361077 RepID=A0A151ZJI0_TIELA|nr:hypothetical protein DLAC_04334 [Tieghemostelium lacteum]|eukprot:KYQ94059.1 hypothetical protein DLAC_04334 [Tieghemostelium lacteum]
MTSLLPHVIIQRILQDIFNINESIVREKDKFIQQFISKFTLVSKIWNSDIIPKLILPWSITIPAFSMYRQKEIKYLVHIFKLLEKYRFIIGNDGLEFSYVSDDPILQSIDSVRNAIRSVTTPYEFLNNFKDYTKLHQITIVVNKNENVNLPINQSNTTLEYHLQSNSGIYSDILKQPFSNVTLNYEMLTPLVPLPTCYSNTIKHFECNQLIIEPKLLVDILLRLPSLEILHLLYPSKSKIDEVQLIGMILDSISSSEATSVLNTLKKLKISGTTVSLDKMIRFLNHTKCLDIVIEMITYKSTDLERDVYQQTIDNTITQSFNFQPIVMLDVSLFQIWKDSSNMKSIQFSGCAINFHPENKKPFVNLKTLEINPLGAFKDQVLSNAPHLEVMVIENGIEFSDLIEILKLKNNIRELGVFCVHLKDDTLSNQDAEILTNAIANNNSIASLFFQFDHDKIKNYSDCYINMLCEILSRNHRIYRLSLPISYPPKPTPQQVNAIKQSLSNNHTIVCIEYTSGELCNLLKSLNIHI